MSTQLFPHYTEDAGNPKYAIVSNFVGEAIIAAGDAVPVDGQAGYGEGCLFIKNAGSEDAQVYVNVGSGSSCNFDPISTSALDGLTASVAELNYLDQSLAEHTLTRGTGVDGSEAYHSSIARVGGIIVTQIYINIDDLVGSATDLDIIGETATANCHWGRIETAKSGIIFGGKVTCLEVPAGGSADVDFYASDVATGTQDVIITDAALGTETALVTAGGAWTLSAPVKAMSGLPAANDYIYVVNGAASGGTFSAGKFLVELYGLPA